MADRDTVGDDVAKESPQPLLGFLSNDDWDALLAHVNDLIEQMENLPAGEVRDRMFELLNGIDTIHREALHRLVRLFAEGVLEKVVSDPAIHTLMELYDLLPPETGVQEPEGSKRKGVFPTIPIKPVRMNRPTPVRYPHWVPVPKSESGTELGSVKEVNVEGVAVVLCWRDDQVFALESRCARDGASLGRATLSGYTLNCPNHTGCYYDIRQGSPLGGGEKIACYPVKLDANGRLLIGVDMDFIPNLPSF